MASVTPVEHSDERRSQRKCEPADKPGSVNDDKSPRVVIHLGHTSPCTSCGLPESSAGRANGFLFGLAPGGVYPATHVATRAVRSYRTLSPLPTWQAKQAVYFLRHFPWAYAPQALPGTLPCGARTFLPPIACSSEHSTSQRLPGRLAAPVYVRLRRAVTLPAQTSGPVPKLSHFPFRRPVCRSWTERWRKVPVAVHQAVLSQCAPPELAAVVD
jgi:hypothetical protein